MNARIQVKRGAARAERLKGLGGWVVLKYAKSIPGDDPVADAYNLMVAACRGTAGVPMARRVAAGVCDWEQVAANAAFLAATFAGFAEHYCGNERPVDLVAGNLALRL